MQNAEFGMQNKTSAWWRKVRRSSFTLLLSAFGLVAAWALLNLVIGGQCDGKCVTDTLAQTLRVATPIAFAAFCGVLCLSLIHI